MQNVQSQFQISVLFLALYHQNNNDKNQNPKSESVCSQAIPPPANSNVIVSHRYWHCHPQHTATTNEEQIQRPRPSFTRHTIQCRFSPVRISVDPYKLVVFGAINGEYVYCPMDELTVNIDSHFGYTSLSKKVKSCAVPFETVIVVQATLTTTNPNNTVTDTKTDCNIESPMQ